MALAFICEHPTMDKAQGFSIAIPKYLFTYLQFTSQSLLLLHNSVLYFEHKGTHIYITLICHWSHHLAHYTPYLTSNLPVPLTLPMFSLPIFTLSVRSIISLSLCDLLHLTCPPGPSVLLQVTGLYSIFSSLMCHSFEMLEVLKWEKIVSRD